MPGRTDTTPVFSVPTRFYVRALVRRFLKRWLWCAVGIAVLLACLAVRDVRFAYLLLMLVFVVYPMAMSLVWLSITGRRAFTLLSRPQRWTFSDEASAALTVEFFAFGTEADEPGTPVESLALAESDIRGIERGRQHTLIRVSPNFKPLQSVLILIVPSGFMPSAGDVPENYDSFS